MKKTVAFCNMDVSDQLDLTDLCQMLPNYSVMHGSEVLEKVNAGEILAENVLVIQECNAKIARKLRKKGAVALINYCFESRIYAVIFYAKLKKIATEFKYRIYFKGMFEGLKNCEEKNNFCAKYYGISDFKPDNINWEDREFLSVVIKNKYVEQKNLFPVRELNVGRFIKWFFRLFYETPEKIFLQENELQNKRFELIEYFGSKGLLKMYGKYWENLEELPKSWRKRLKDLIKALNVKPVKNKLEIISKYKFNLAFENLSEKGYVTEKILEALVAKTIPIYLGAPDIADYIPKGCFIDFRDFKTIDDLYDYMKNMTSENAQSYFDCAKEFLASEEAKEYTRRGFCRQLANLVQAYEM